MVRQLVAIIAVILASACSGSSPSSPAPSAPTATIQTTGQGAWVNCVAAGGHLLAAASSKERHRTLVLAAPRPCAVRFDDGQSQQVS